MIRSQMAWHYFCRVVITLVYLPRRTITMSKFAPLKNDLLLRAVRGMLTNSPSPSESSQVEQANVWNDHQYG